ncbi:MAG: DUF2235 domain-containing protein [Pseudomonadota bacterium]
MKNGKNIVVCSDGTGNSAVKGRGTNVFKLYEAVDVIGHIGTDECEQVAIYDDGVGTQKLKPFRIFGGAFGFGLARNVRQLYAEIARIYEAGDRIYLFGFSRGAFTVRTLAGFIDKVGILDVKNLTTGEVSSEVSRLYREHRKDNRALLEYFTSFITDIVRSAWRLLLKLIGSGQPDIPPPVIENVPIQFIGVWDTVDAVGFPVPGIASFWNTVIHKFKFETSELPKSVVYACHALAIDDERASFWPSLWKKDTAPTGGEAEKKPARMEQAWFAGVHSNVGGGYPKQGMSLVSLDWMMRKAESSGSKSQTAAPPLRFSRALRQQYADAQNVTDYLYDSRSGLAVYYRYRPRDIGALCREAEVPVVIHRSVTDRIRARTRGYAPGNLPDSFHRLDGPREGEHRLVSPADEKDLPDFSGSSGRWVRLRQFTQVGFFAVQAVVIYLAWTATVTDELLPASTSDASILEKAKGWAMQVAELLVAPLPGDWAAARIVQPMFAYPWIGLLFLAAIVTAYFLGLLGRTRMEAENSERWRRLEIRRAGEPPAS